MSSTRLARPAESAGPGGHDERDQTLNQLLVEMDGFDANRGIILLAATNRPETLDQALVRPGRFDRQVVVDRPDLIGREQILKVHARTVPLEESINLRHIAAITPGFVGADLANLVNEAALLAARRGKTTVGLPEFEEGIERLIAGPEKRQRLLRREEKRRIAFHEAGHALVARKLPETDPVHKITIIGRGNGALGYTLYRPEEDCLLHTRTSLENLVSSLLGGHVGRGAGPGRGLRRLLERSPPRHPVRPANGRRVRHEPGSGPLELSQRPRAERLRPRRNSPGANRPPGRSTWRFAASSTKPRPGPGSSWSNRQTLDEIAARLIDQETIDAAELQQILEHAE